MKEKGSRLISQCVILLPVNCALSSLFCPLSHNSLRVILFLLCSLAPPLLHFTFTSSLLYDSIFFSPMNFTLPHSLLSNYSTLMPSFLKILYFSSHPSSSIPITSCHSRQNYYSWMEHRLSGAVRCSLNPHYPFMEYPFLWRAIFL